MWIYEQKDWPNFTWDINVLALKLATIRYNQGKLLGKMEGLGFELHVEANLETLTNDVVKSSIIEGESLNADEVRSSIARKLGVNVAGLIRSSRDIDGVVEMMLDATQQFEKPLTKERLRGWHAALFPSGRSGIYKITVAEWRQKESDPMQVVSGAIGKEKVHYKAPDAEQLEKEMEFFLDWVDTNTDNIDPVLKAGIAHLWFLTIHPFADGNGRIARAIGDMLLARADDTKNRFYSLSSQIEKERTSYYNQLEKQQRGTLDVTEWFEWFLDCLGRAIDDAEITLSSTLLKAKLWENIHKHSINDRQRLIINRMLEKDFKGYMNTSKYAKIAKCSTDTALRDIQDLLSNGILLKNQGGGRSTSYRLTEDA